MVAVKPFLLDTGEGWVLFFQYNKKNSMSIDNIMQQAAIAFQQYRETKAEQKAVFLETIAANMEAAGAALIGQAAEETHLPQARLVSERARTTMQLRMFAALLREGSWVEATVDTADATVNPAKPDIRKMLIPLGPVVVFGASNFPFAYSTAGGDTASALAAGCAVVVKAHPAHLKTSQLVHKAIKDAIFSSGMPPHVFQHVEDGSFEAGESLVKHAATAAVGFTGSFAGGKALYDHAAARKNPIPVFAEMGSTNPIILLPDTLEKNAEELARQYIASVVLGMGQFCTNPGIVLGIESEGLSRFIAEAEKEIAAAIPQPMLHEGIYKAYHAKMEKALQQTGVNVVGHSSTEPGAGEAWPTLAETDGTAFLSNPLLHEEVFGPYAIIVRCTDLDQLQKVWRSLAGQLTTSLMGTEKDFTEHASMRALAESIAGRIIFNGVPTGVTVCNSMVHGGPFPATTDSRFTAVGINGIKRWVRPVCYQNCPQTLLPPALQNGNPLGIWRLVNNEWTR
ncbi:aldehyde dehydrogenase (NADP(+)) [Sediminibacterium ginsengisoli]